MSREEFESKQEELQNRIGMGIAVGYETLADFVIGCFFDDNIGQWKVYENYERGMRTICLTTENEEGAFDELYFLIQWKIEKTC